MKLKHDEHDHRMFGICEACIIEREWKDTPGCSCREWLRGHAPSYSDALFFDQHGHYPACESINTRPPVRRATVTLGEGR